MDDKRLLDNDKRFSSYRDLVIDLSSSVLHVTSNISTGEKINKQDYQQKSAHQFIDTNIPNQDSAEDPGFCVWDDEDVQEAYKELKYLFLESSYLKSLFINYPYNLV
jgi:hypothetical protein